MDSLHRNAAAHESHLCCFYSMSQYKSLSCQSSVPLFLIQTVRIFSYAILFRRSRKVFAADGTPLKTARLERSKRICGCPKGSDCGCKHKFSQPDCRWRLDSSRNKYFLDTIFACLLLLIQYLFQQNQFQSLHKFQLLLYLKKNIVQMYHIQNYKP